MSLDTRILSLLASLELEMDSGIAYQQRPKGGQQTGPPSSAFCTTPPSAVIRIRRLIKNVRKECHKEEQSHLSTPCCDNENRSFEGGCLSCGAPCL